MKPRRVVITGIGVVAPNGIGKHEFWDSLVKGKSGIKHLTLFDPTGLPTDIAGEVSQFDPHDFMPPRQVKGRGRASHLGVAAARLALEDAGISDTSSIGLAVGMTFPAMDYVEHFVHQFSKEKRYLRNDLFLLYTSVSPNMVAMDISCLCGIKGNRETIANACSSGSLALVKAFDRIRRGQTDVYLAGGVDACLTYLGFAALIAGGFQVVSKRPPEEVSRPYDLDREGGVASEGAALLVLESLDHALARAAPIYAEILGGGISAQSPTSGPESARIGLATSISTCLQNSKISPYEIDYICSHGPSLPVIDHMETLAIKDVFDSYAYRIPITSIKSTIGNPMSASGPMQVAAALLAMANSLIPPTANLKTPDPQCDLDYVPLEPRAAILQTSLIDSHGFDNVDVSIVVSTRRL